ncbi:MULTISPECIES: BolA/IbaG family iron-sulfur metabolism protein [unclassified Francisella]|uniref:BolA/IbaG family iron-sulfur metabolism protein n=1 Tax=unclassified Francisella TaxID=2610885 RepID=UPI002E34F734|nr:MULTISPECIES: BolA/IbaG family iron-sulfur metabolism protein [unclassified Francisella]MED7819223.1 BolA/IbaG family iron-sulfur metabolism protein [Francisella sp. 19S2-4]MED7830012.1 BolA/IbaG family iron-sulfur metabolism protein [Francisella sp. 19S2-10]
MDSITVTNQIKELILSKIDPQASVEIINETHKHIKHRGYTEGKYNFVLNISSQKLSAMRKISSHKEIFKAIDNLMPYIHALSIKIKPE